MDSLSVENQWSDAEGSNNTIEVNWALRQIVGSYSACTRSVET